MLSDMDQIKNLQYPFNLFNDVLPLWWPMYSIMWVKDLIAELHTLADIEKDAIKLRYKYHLAFKDIGKIIGVADYYCARRIINNGVCRLKRRTSPRSRGKQLIAQYNLICSKSIVTDGCIIDNSIDELNITNHLYLCLLNQGIYDINTLISFTEDELKYIDGIEESEITELINAVTGMDLEFKQSDDDAELNEIINKYK